MRSALLALLGVALVVAGVSMVSVAAGVITAGSAAIVGAYVIRYVEVNSADS